MKVLVVKDGTVPILVAKVLYTDLRDTVFEGVGNIEHEVAELFDVGNIYTEALYVCWADGEGFSVSPVTMSEGFVLLQDPSDPREPITEVSPGHFVTTVDPGDNEWYAHLFDLRGLA